MVQDNEGSGEGNPPSRFSGFSAEQQGHRQMYGVEQWLTRHSLSFLFFSEADSFRGNWCKLNLKSKNSIEKRKWHKGRMASSVLFMIILFGDSDLGKEHSGAQNHFSEAVFFSAFQHKENNQSRLYFRVLSRSTIHSFSNDVGEN